MMLSTSLECETTVDLIIPFWTEDTFPMMLVVLPADEFLGLQLVNKTFPNSI